MKILTETYRPGMQSAPALGPNTTQVLPSHFSILRNGRISQTSQMTNTNQNIKLEIIQILVLAEMTAIFLTDNEKSI